MTDQQSRRSFSGIELLLTVVVVAAVVAVVMTLIGDVSNDMLKKQLMAKQQEVVDIRQRNDLVPKPGTIPDRARLNTISELLPERYGLTMMYESISADEWVRLIHEKSAEFILLAQREQNVHLLPAVIVNADCGVGYATGFGVYSPRDLSEADMARVTQAWDDVSANAEKLYDEAVRRLPYSVGYPSFGEMRQRVSCPSP